VSPGADTRERRAVAFGAFRLDPEGQLWRGKSAIPLPPKESALLGLLAEAEGRLLTKRDILDRIWPAQEVGEDSLTRCIRGLRRALGEGGRRGGTIETLHGRGYRLSAPVHSPAVETRSESDRTALRVGVVPFDVVGARRESRYLGPGIAGEVTDQLARCHRDGITILARQSARRLRRGAEDLLRIAGQLRLDYVVTGRLSVEGDERRLQVELVRVSDEALAWCEEFRSRRKLLPQLAAEIAESIAKELGRRLPAPVVIPATCNDAPPAKSYLALLQGQFAGQLRTERGIRRGIECFEQAIAWAPDYAEAYAALAEAYLFQGKRGFVAPIDIAPRVRAAVDRALALNPGLVPALAALAYLRLDIDFDPQAALRAVERGNAIEPGNPRIEWMRGQILHAEGRFDEALAAYRASMDADPFSPSTAASVPFTLYCAGRFDEALAEARAIAEREPEFALGHAVRAGIAAASGRRKEAIHGAELAESLARGDQLTLGTCAWALGVAGRTAHAEAIRTALEQKATRRYVAPSYLAVAAVGLGDEAGALAWLERGLEHRCMFLPMVAVDLRFAPLRGHPRFEAVTAAARGRHHEPKKGQRRGGKSFVPAKAGRARAAR